MPKDGSGLSLDGLGLPLGEPVLGHLRRLRDLLLGLRDRVQWIQALRKAPERRNPDRGSELSSLKPNGDDACHALRTDDEILQEVSSWYEENAGRIIELRDAPPSDFRVLLRPKDAEFMDVDLVDAGTQLEAGPRQAGVDAVDEVHDRSAGAVVERPAKDRVIDEITVREVTCTDLGSHAREGIDRTAGRGGDRRAWQRSS